MLNYLIGKEKGDFKTTTAKPNIIVALGAFFQMPAAITLSIMGTLRLSSPFNNLPQISHALYILVLGVLAIASFYLIFSNNLKGKFLAVISGLMGIIGSFITIGMVGVDPLTLMGEPPTFVIFSILVLIGGVLAWIGHHYRESRFLKRHET